ncbi:MAG: asparagine--tRNA ligase, partial [Candidatus Kariarchaeaceae archaeon]
MSKRIKLKQVKEFSGQEISVDAWVLNIRRQGKKLAFVSLFDGTGELQATLKQNIIGEKFGEIETIYRGASILIEGSLAEDARAPGGYELQVKTFDIHHPSEESYDSEVGPESSIDIKLSKRHIVLRGPKSSSVLRFTSHVLKYLRDFFYSRGLEEVFPPLITEAQAEGGSELFEVDYFGQDAYLTQSSQLYLEAAIFALRDVFCILPSFRAEKSRTQRHLAEYRHIEAEFAFADFGDLKEFIEDMIIYVAKQVKENDSDILELWDRDLEVPSKPFPRITYEEAVSLLQEEFDIEIPYGEDISDAPERKLVEHFGKPIILEHFPTHMKPFYHKINAENPDITNSADFLFPICGELVGSGERETDIDSMLERMAAMDPPLDPADYTWYLDLRRYGSVTHSGFGMGLERLIHWLLDLESVRDATFFPRTVNRL